MEAAVKSDIFFFITSIAVILITAFVIAVLLYALAILRDVAHITSIVRKKSDYISDEISTAYDTLKRSEFGLKPLRESLAKTARAGNRMRKKKTAEVEEFVEKALEKITPDL